MENVTYKIKDYSKQFLQRHRFKYSNYLSEYGDEVYTYKFPLISYNKTTSIECEIAVSIMTGIVNVKVYKAGTRELYPAFYNREYGTCKLIESMDLKINRKFKELGIEKT